MYKLIREWKTFSGYPKQTIAEAPISSSQATMQLTLKKYKIENS